MFFKRIYARTNPAKVREASEGQRMETSMAYCSRGTWQDYDIDSTMQRQRPC